MDTTAALAPEPTISELEWNRILGRIADHKVIPVIGEHLTSVRREEAGEGTSLAAYLSAELGVTGPPTESLNEVALRYLRDRPQGRGDLYVDVVASMKRLERAPIPAPLRQLAEIRDFQLYVTTSFDPFLAFAVNEVRFGSRTSSSTSVFSYECNRSVDLPKDVEELDHPVVYHLFGKARTTNVFGLTDEDVLELVHTLQARECQPPRLFRALEDQRILLLGTRLTGWLTRFFLRISAPDRLINRVNRTDYVVDPAAIADTDQTLFLERFGGARLVPMAPVPFVAELSRRWRALHPTLAPTPGPAASPGPPVAAGGEVFISYASEDREVVIGLRERLEREAGVHVWVDKDHLRGGEEWEQHIDDELRSCAVCIPVVSAHVKSGAWRYVRTEWDRAVRLRPGKLDRDFIHPLVIDDTRPDDEKLDPEIRKLHWRSLLDEEDLRRFVAEVREAAGGHP